MNVTVVVVLPHIEGVDLCVQAFIMGTQSPQDIPDNLVIIVVVKCIFRIFILRYDERDDDITVLFAGSLPHHATDRLDHVDQRAFGAHEYDCVQRRNVYSFAQAPDVGECPAASVLVALFQPVHHLFPVAGFHPSVDVLYFQMNGTQRLMRHFVKRFGDNLGGGYGVAENDRRPHRIWVCCLQGLIVCDVLFKGIEAAPDLAAGIHVDGSVFLNPMFLDYIRYILFRYG